MLGLTSEPTRHLFGRSEDGWRERTGLAEWERAGGPPLRWLVTGAVVLGLGVLAWSYLGPDLRRYVKIHRM